MNTNPYSYDQCLAIIDLCVGLETHKRLEPDAYQIRTLGIGLVNGILEMNHLERILLIKEVADFL